MKITLKCGTVFDVNEGEVILDKALESNIFLSHSCKTGQCDSCKTMVLSGDTSVLSPEIALHKKDIDAGYILTCCRAPKTDLRLDCNNLVKFSKLKKTRIPAKILKLNKITCSLMILELQMHPSSEFQFIAGQYIDLSWASITRSYSIMEYDKEKKILRLFIKNYEKGAMSNYLFNDAKLGDLLRVFGPHGTFSFDELSTFKKNIFFATGTGIAPFVSILNDLESKKEKVSISLYWGNRFEDEFLDLPNYKYIDLQLHKALSREKKDGFYHGYIQDCFSELESDYQFIIPYICGSKNMIESVEKKLINSGYKGIILTDAFVSHTAG
jgi:CDP-4-dehydro-6-deoxyglucose reductase